MNVQVTFPGGKRVDATVGDFVVRTDQPAELGGEGSAPGPFEIFLASLASCAGIYALGFCQARGLSTEGLGLTLRVEADASTKLPAKIAIDIQLPVGFPEKYVSAIVRAAEGCKVKKTIAAQPIIEVAAALQPTFNVQAI